MKKNSRKTTHASVTVTVVRVRKIQTGLRTNQIVGIVTSGQTIKYLSLITIPLGLEFIDV